VDTSHTSSSHHSSINTSNNIADAAAEQAARKRAGLCPQCGVVQTHTKKWGRRKPIQVGLWFMGEGEGVFIWNLLLLPQYLTCLKSIINGT